MLIDLVLELNHIISHVSELLIIWRHLHVGDPSFQVRDHGCQFLIPWSGLGVHGLHPFVHLAPFLILYSEDVKAVDKGKVLMVFTLLTAFLAVGSLLVVHCAVSFLANIENGFPSAWASRSSLLPQGHLVNCSLKVLWLHSASKSLVLILTPNKILLPSIG